jgi:protein TonB
VAGRIRNSDYPKAAGAAGVGGTVSVLYVVAPSGRVTDCEVTRSSGSAALDDTTCDLIIARFRFEPARDADGRPVESMIEENHRWIVE